MEGDSAVVAAGGGRSPNWSRGPCSTSTGRELAGVTSRWGVRRPAQPAERLPFRWAGWRSSRFRSDTAELLGVDAIAQVDLMRRIHRQLSDERKPA